VTLSIAQQLPPKVEEGYIVHRIGSTVDNRVALDDKNREDTMGMAQEKVEKTIGYPKVKRGVFHLVCEENCHSRY
jgi:hypothetical protein